MTAIIREMFRADKVVVLSLILVAVLAGCAGDTGGGGDSGRKEAKSSGEEVHTTGGTQTTQEGRMSLRDAVGQMFVVSMSGTEPNYYVEKMVRERNVGGVLLFASNMESEAQTRQLVGSLQQLSMQTEPSVPLFVAVDQEGGEVSSAPWVAPQPSAAQVGSTEDSQRARAVAGQMGRQLRQAGVNTDLAPVADTGSGAAIGSRSFGSDPELVSRMVAASVEGFESAGVVSSAKHFPNHGPATVDSHTGRPVIRHDAWTIHSYDLPPFRAAVEAGVPMVMVGHLIYPAIDPERPASLSPEAIGMLRDELGFEGVVVTDDLSMDGAKRGSTTPQAAVEAVKAGADMVIISDVPEVQDASYRAVLEAVESGEISREQVYDSVGRITAVKEEYPLYEGR